MRQQPFLIGGLQYFRHRISLLGQSSLLYYDQTGPPYPPNTKAFLYYSTLPEKPRIAGELRLRVISSDGPQAASFESGSDLLLTNGQPWFRPLYTLSKRYLSLYKKLSEDGLVPDDLDTALSTLPSKDVRFRRSHILYRLNDTFIFEFGCFYNFLFVITEQGVEKLRFYNSFSDGREMLKNKIIYTGAYTNHHLSILPY